MTHRSSTGNPCKKTLPGYNLNTQFDIANNGYVLLADHVTNNIVGFKNDNYKGECIFKIFQPALVGEKLLSMSFQLPKIKILCVTN